MGIQAAFIGAPLALPSQSRSSKPGLCARRSPCMVAENPVQEKKKDKAPKSSASWANVWLPEFPEKGAGSVIGWDLRPDFIRNNTESAICDLCTGTGKTVCTLCNGHDFMGPEGKIICNGCKGEHTVTCSTCYGSGRAVGIQGKWWEWDFSKIFKK